MACWVGIESRRDWWPTTTPLMAKCAPFRLNSIMSHNWFDSILSAIRFTNREVPYEDGFLQMIPEDYLEEVLIPNTDKGLSVPMDL